MDISELNSLLKNLGLRLTNENKNLLLSYSEKRGLDVKELQNDISKIGIDKLLSVRAPRFLNSSALSFHEFLFVLKRNGFSLTLDHAEIRELYEIFMSMHKENVHNMDRATVSVIFKGAKKYMIANTDKFVDFSKVKDLIKAHQTETDLKLYKAFYKIDQKFKETNLYGEKLPVDTLIKQCFKKAQQVCAELNVEEDRLTDDVVNIIWSLACIYDSLVNYTSSISQSTGARLSAYAERLLQERILAKSTLFYKDLLNNYPDIEFEKTQMFYFEQFLEALTSDPAANKDELFNQQDVYDLINHTPYLVFAANKEKLEGARFALNLYMESVLKEFPKIKRKTTKDIFKKAGSILDNSPIANENAVRLLLGEDVGSILKYNYGKDHYLSRKNTLKQDYMKMSFGSLRISGMDLNKHSYVLNTRNSIFTQLSVDNMYDCISNVLTLTCDAIGIDEQYLSTKKLALDRLGFSVAQMFTGDNIFDIFDVSSKFISQTNEKREDLENYKQNVKVLSGLIALPDIFKVVQHNFKFLTQNNMAEYSKLIAESKTAEDLHANLIKLINSKAKKSTRNAGAVAQEGKYTKLQTAKIEIEQLSIDAEILGALGFACQFELPKEKAKKPATRQKKDSGTADLESLIQLENDINNTDDDSLPYEVEDDLIDEEDAITGPPTSPYDDWAKLQFEMSAISEYFSKIKPVDTSKRGWYKSHGKTNTHVEDSAWLKAYPTYKDTIIYDLLERNTTQFVSTFTLPENKTSVRLMDKNLNALFDKILAVKDEIVIDVSAIDDTIEYLTSIIETKQADKRTMMDEVMLSTKTEPNPMEQPKYIDVLIKRTQKLAQAAKRSKVPGLISAAAQQLEELKTSKAAAKNDMSAYGTHLESKRSATGALEECARLSKFIEAIETIKTSFEKFRQKLTAELAPSAPQTQDPLASKRLAEIDQKIEELTQSLTKREQQAERLRNGTRSGAKDLLSKVTDQIKTKRKKLEELEKSRQELLTNQAPSTTDITKK